MFKNVVQEKRWRHVDDLAQPDKIMPMPLQFNSSALPLDLRQGFSTQRTGVEASVAISKDTAAQCLDHSRDTVLRNSAGREPRSLQPPDRPQCQTFGQETIANLHHEKRLAVRGRRMVLRELLEVGKFHWHPLGLNRHSTADVLQDITAFSRPRMASSILMCDPAKPPASGGGERMQEGRMAGMRDETRALLDLFRLVVARWHRWGGVEDVRGSASRKYVADQLFRYRRMLGRNEFLQQLREALRNSDKDNTVD
jgi:hypothetical protein